MPIEDLYSSRNKNLPDVYTYYTFPLGLKNQIIHIWNNFFDQYRISSDIVRETFFYKANKIIAEHHELRELPKNRTHESDSSIMESYFRNLIDAPLDADKALDIVEIVFRGIENTYTSKADLRFGSKYTANAAIEDLNFRFRQKGIGYEYKNRKIFRIDSQLLHSEVVQPVLSLLSDNKFETANNEYLKAHEHFRYNRYSECIAECAKAFESTMKIICGIRGWSYDKDKDTARHLIDICITNELIPKYLTDFFTGVRTTLLNGVPTTRNKTSSHGVGEEKKELPEYLASFILHQTAVSIKLLVEANNVKP